MMTVKAKKLHTFLDFAFCVRGIKKIKYPRPVDQFSIYLFFIKSFINLSNFRRFHLEFEICLEKQ